MPADEYIVSLECIDINLRSRSVIGLFTFTTLQLTEKLQQP